jgi:hypothetical protein
MEMSVSYGKLVDWTHILNQYGKLYKLLTDTILQVVESCNCELENVLSMSMWDSIHRMITLTPRAAVHVSAIGSGFIMVTFLRAVSRFDGSSSISSPVLSARGSLNDSR